MKALIKRVLGPRLSYALSTGMETMRHYPQYVLGRGIARPPRSVELEITFACNARCRMCPLYGEHTDNQRPQRLGDRPKELTTVEIRRLIEDCGAMGVRRFAFTGGEAFIRPDLLELVGLAKREGMEVTMISNGSLIDETRARGIVEAGLDSILISVDGPPEVHDSIRRVPGMFRRIDQNIGYLRAAQKELGRTNPVICVGCIVSTLNQEDLEELVYYGRQWNVWLGYSALMFSTPQQDAATGRMVDRTAQAEKPESWHLTDKIRRVDPDLLQAELDRVRDAARRLGVHVDIKMVDRQDIIRRYHDASYAEGNKCMYPWIAARLNPYGEVYPCSILTRMGNIREKPLAEIWNDKPYVEFRRELRRVGLFPKCAKCCVLDRGNILIRVLPRLTWLRSGSPNGV